MRHRIHCRGYQTSYESEGGGGGSDDDGEDDDGEDGVDVGMEMEQVLEMERVLGSARVWELVWERE